MPRFGDFGDAIPAYDEDELVGPRTADDLHCDLIFDYDGQRRQIVVTALYGRIDATEYFRGRNVETGHCLTFKTSRVQALCLRDGRITSNIAWWIGDAVRRCHGLPLVEAAYVVVLPELPAIIRFLQADGELDPATGQLWVQEREIEYAGVALALALEHRSFATRHVLTFRGRPTDGSKRTSTFRVSSDGGRVLSCYIDADSGDRIQDWPRWLRSRAI